MFRVKIILDTVKKGHPIKVARINKAQVTLTAQSVYFNLKRTSKIL